MYIFTVILLFVFDFFRFPKADQFNSFKSFIQCFLHNLDKSKFALEGIFKINLSSQ